MAPSAYLGVLVPLDGIPNTNGGRLCLRFSILHRHLLLRTGQAGDSLLHELAAKLADL